MKLDKWEKLVIQGLLDSSKVQKGSTFAYTLFIVLILKSFYVKIFYYPGIDSYINQH